MTKPEDLPDSTASVLHAVDFGVPLPPQVRAGYTQRVGGVSRAPYGRAQGQDFGLNLGLHVGDDALAVKQNRAMLQAQMGQAQPRWLNQVHGVRVVDLSRVAADEVVDADASVCSQAGIACTIMTADCLPVLFCDATGSVVAAAHAGWRGLYAGVLHNTVRAMRASGADEIYAWLGPAIGPRHFEVGAEVMEAFSDQFSDECIAQTFQPHASQAGKYHADLFGLARAALQQLELAHIAGGGDCTASQPDKYYSYRRDHITGRMASLIWLDE